MHPNVGPGVGPGAGPGIGSKVVPGSGSRVVHGLDLSLGLLILYIILGSLCTHDVPAFSSCLSRTWSVPVSLLADVAEEVPTELDAKPNISFRGFLNANLQNFYSSVIFSVAEVPDITSQTNIIFANL